MASHIPTLLNHSEILQHPHSETWHVLQTLSYYTSQKTYRKEDNECITTMNELHLTLLSKQHDVDQSEGVVGFQAPFSVSKKGWPKAWLDRWEGNRWQRRDNAHTHYNDSSEAERGRERGRKLLQSPCINQEIRQHRQWYA